MVKLQDFATQSGITDRQVQRLVKKYESELVGHFERRGYNGTWLDEEACDILRGKMKIKSIAIAEETMTRKIQELENRIERKDVIIDRLQHLVQEKDTMIEEMKSEQLLLETRNQERLEIELKATAEATEERIRTEMDEVYQAQEQILKNEFEKQIQELREELQAEKNKTWWQKLRKK